jgi:diacylglycerol O-acyltransferase
MSWHDGQVADRLSAMDASFLYLEGVNTPMHVGSLVLFSESPGAMDHERLVRLISQRISLLPRYRQRVKEIPGGLAAPVWVDDPTFDVSFHVRRSALPAPGSREQLYDLLARIFSRPLDRRHPLWEVYLVEGIEGRRFALLTKTHQAMVNGLSAIDIAEVILDESQETAAIPAGTWRPSPEPSSAELLVGAVGDSLRSPRAMLGRVKAGVLSAARSVGDVAATVVDAARPDSVSPLVVDVGAQRRFETVDLRLAEFKRIRQSTGGSITDIALAVVTGALRSWLFSRGVSVATDTVVRAVVPVSVAADDPRASTVSAVLLDLPVGEPDPVIRVQRIGFDMARHGAESRVFGAQSFVELVGFAPPTMHALGARVGSSISKRAYHLLVTNVPGPQTPRFAGGARMLAAYPVLPLGPCQPLSVGITSYDGGVFIGITADRETMTDLDVLIDAIREAQSELLDATGGSQRRRLKVAPEKEAPDADTRKSGKAQAARKKNT